MTNLVAILPYIQMALSILLIVAILIQKSETSVGGSFGGNDNFSAGFHTRRGFEQKLFYFTIALVILFVITSVLSMLFR
jgi:protein translocase SecG subunit